MRQGETTTKNSGTIRNDRLNELMAIANQVARYASTNDQGQFERARAWQQVSD